MVKWGEICIASISKTMSSEETKFEWLHMKIKVCMQEFSFKLLFSGLHELLELSSSNILFVHKICVNCLNTYTIEINE